MLKIMEKLKFPIDLKNRFIVSYVYGDHSCCFLGNSEDVLWGLREHEVLIKIQEYDEEIMIVEMQLGSDWYDIHGTMEVIVNELNAVIVDYFRGIAYKKGIVYEY